MNGHGVHCKCVGVTELDHANAIGRVPGILCGPVGGIAGSESVDAMSVAMAIEVVLSESSTRLCHDDDALRCNDDDAIWCKMHQGAMLDALSRGDVQCIFKFNPG